ncbi:MAG: hypothetical protein HQL36_05740 [Alphaproteobacteria bacterium]|nr:hypothetical protein [Alphaproteobacteria bacterium]MBF0250402.1 hypothetical protein [Alphaproteobacteria bacterium]
MTITSCPDCATGWRYAEDLVGLRTQEHRHRHGLVPCPTCAGTGRIVGAVEKPAPSVVEARVTYRRFGADAHPAVRGGASSGLRLRVGL